MKNGAKYSMPLIFLSLGGEMFYILNQRLHAQNIGEEKSTKVLQDLALMMFSPEFIDELFRSKEIYNIASVKQIFDKIAHSSIIRLNSTSMEKLFDLMFMVFKYQLLLCNSPQQILHVVFLHLESIKDITRNNSIINELIDYVANETVNLYSGFSIYSWYQLKSSLFCFVQDKNVKVSIFLQHELQSCDGTIHLLNDVQLPYGTKSNGIATYFESGSKVYEKSVEDSRKQEESTDILDASSVLGQNIYDVKFDKNVKKLRKFLSITAECSKIMFENGNFGFKTNEVVLKHSNKYESKNLSGAKVELNILANLLGIIDRQSESKDRKDTFKMNLFPDSTFISKEGDERWDSSVIVVNIDASSDSKSIQRYTNDLKLQDFDHKESDNKVDEEDDLLSLMDSVK